MDAPIYCNKCGSPNAAMGVYCSRCGTPLNPAASSAAGTAAAPGAAMAYAPAAAAGVRYGGFWIRVVALIVDEIIVHMATAPIAILLGLGGLGLLGAHGGFSPGDFDHLDMDMLRLYIVGGLSLFLLRVVGRWLYEALMTSSSYQATLGKMIFGMKVTDLYGNRISFARAAGRYFAKLLSGMILGIGFLMVAFTARKQGLHDMIAETLVKR